MAFKIKDGVRIGTVDVFNNGGQTLNLKVKDTAGAAGAITLDTQSLGATSYTQTLQNKTGTIALISDIVNSVKATATTLGTVELFSNTVQSVAANAVSTTANRTYGVQLNSDDQMVVNVPWVDTTVEADTLQTVTGRGASSNVATISLSGGTASSNTTTGTLVVTGGVGISGALNVGGAAAVGGSLTVTGDLTVNGTTTTVNSNTITVDDKNLELGSVIAIASVSGTIAGITTTTTITGITSTTGMIPGQALTKISGTGAFGGVTTITSVDSSTQITITSATANTAGAIVFSVGAATDVTADGGGITLRGTTNKTFNWVDSTDAWTSSEHLAVAAGKTLRVSGVTSGTTIIQATAIAGSGTLTLPTATGTIALTSDLPVKATATVLGIVKLADATVQTVAATASSTTASRTYGIQLNAADQMVVNVPWSDTNTTYAKATSTVLGLVELADDAVQTIAANASSITAGRTYGIQLNAADQAVVNVPWTDTLPNNGALTLSIGTAAATNTTVTIGTGTGFTANSSAASTYDIKVGPALTALATLMTTAGAGFIKRGATADTYTIDTNTYLTAEADTLATVTGRGNTTTTDVQLNNSSLVLAPTGTTAKVWKRAVTATLALNTATAIDSWAAGTYRSAKYYVQATQGVKYYSAEINVIHDGTAAYITEFAVLENSAMAWGATSWTATIAGGTLTLSALITDAATTNVVFQIERTLFAV